MARARVSSLKNMAQSTTALSTRAPCSKASLTTPTNSCFNLSHPLNKPGVTGLDMGTTFMSHDNGDLHCGVLWPSCPVTRGCARNVLGSRWCYAWWILIRWASRRRLTSGWHCYAEPWGDAGPRGWHCYTGVSRRCWTSGWHCYTATLGPRGNTGPQGDTATLGLEETLDLGVTLLCWGALRRRWTSRSRWCHWASCGRWCQWAPRRRWTSGDAGAAGLEETMDLEEMLMPLGLVWTLVPLGSEETMDLGRYWWRWARGDNGPQGYGGLEETLPARAGAGLSKAILGAQTPVAPRTSHSLWSGCWSEECLEQLPLYREIRAAFSIWWSRIQPPHWSFSIQVNKGVPVCLDVVHTFSGGNHVA